MKGSNNDGIASVSSRLHQFFFHTGTGEAIGKVTHGLVVGENGLKHPALGFAPTHLVNGLPRVFDNADSNLILASHRTRPKNRTRCFERGQLCSVFLNEACKRKREVL